MKHSTSCARENSADPDQTAPKEQSDLGLHCLPLLYKASFDRIVGLVKVEMAELLQLDQFHEWLKCQIFYCKLV